MPAAAHPFDEAVALSPLPDGRLAGSTHAGYWNMVGPFGGITAATLLNAVLQHPALLGEPVALTVNYAGAVAPGDFFIDARPVRTNRTTQHWVLSLLQTDGSGVEQVLSTATVVTAVRRETWSASDAPMPAVPPPEALPRADRGDALDVAWLDRYEMRPITGAIPGRWDGQASDSLTRLWVRDHPPRAPGWAALAALADVFFPRIWLRRATRVAAGTVSMTVYFHASAAQLAASGERFLLAQAQGQGYRHGFFDHTGQLWNADGLLLATTHQIVYYKA